MDYYILTPVSFIFRLIEMSIHFYLVSVVLSKKVGINKILVGAMLFSTSYEVIRMILPQQYITWIITICIAIPYIVIVFKVGFWKAVVSYMLVMLIIAVIDCIISFLTLYVFNLDNLDMIFENKTSYYVAHSALIIFTLIVALLIRKAKFKDKLSFEEGVKENFTGIVNTLVTFILLMPNFFMIVYYHDDKSVPIWLIIVNICAIILMFFVSTYNTEKGFELVVAEQELITQKTYNKTLQNLVDGLRTFKHDYSNTLQTMYGYIQLDNMTGLKKFFEQILDESRAITALDKLNPELFKNPSLFGLITAKYEYARQNNVNIDFEMYGELENADMQIYDLTRILGIFLDNAIEASAGSEKKKVNFLVCERKDKVIIEISNSYSEVGLKIEEMKEKGVSSKGENRGLGLYKVKEILGKYQLVKHETTATGGMFMQKLVIDKVKVKA